MIHQAIKGLLIGVFFFSFEALTGCSRVDSHFRVFCTAIRRNIVF